MARMRRMGEDATPDATTRPQTESVEPPKRKKQRGTPPPRQEKPFADFPLTWHSRGYWCKKIDGQQVRYTADWRESYDLWRKDEDARQKGRAVPSLASTTYNVEDAINRFMDRQQERFEDAEISDVQLAKYRIEMEHLARN